MEQILLLLNIIGKYEEIKEKKEKKKRTSKGKEKSIISYSTIAIKVLKKKNERQIAYL